MDERVGAASTPGTEPGGGKTTDERPPTKMVEKRVVKAARNGPSPLRTPAGGPLASPEMSMANRLGSRELAAVVAPFVALTRASTRSSLINTERTSGSD